jgi:hypothetical protein
MKGKVKGLLLFLLGLVIGGVGGFVYMAVQYNKMMALWYGTRVVEMATNAHQVRRGQEREVLKRIDMTLPSVAMTYATLFRSSPGYAGTLWTVQRYYEENPGLQVPPDLKAVLSMLPPRPLTSCELRKTQAASSEPADAAATAPTGQ